MQVIPLGGLLFEKIVHWKNHYRKYCAAVSAFSLKNCGFVLTAKHLLVCFSKAWWVSSQTEILLDSITVFCWPEFMAACWMFLLSVCLKQGSPVLLLCPCCISLMNNASLYNLQFLGSCEMDSTLSMDIAVDTSSELLVGFQEVWSMGLSDTIMLANMPSCRNCFSCSLSLTVKFAGPALPQWQCHCPVLCINECPA